jgi:hypothetical protein
MESDRIADCHECDQSLFAFGGDAVWRQTAVWKGWIRDEANEIENSDFPIWYWPNHSSMKRNIATVVAIACASENQSQPNESQGIITGKPDTQQTDNLHSPTRISTSPEEKSMHPEPIVHII